MNLQELTPWEVSKHFPQSVINYWKPYTDKLDEDEWYLYKIGASKNWNLKSPFLNTWFDCKESYEPLGSHQDKTHPVKCALYKMELYFKTIESKDSDIGDISCASTHVEKWLRETYLYRFLTQHDISRFTNEEVWELISDIWENNEFPCQSEEKREMWSELFNLRQRPESLVSDFPDELTIYRGGHPEGFAWSVSRKIAEGFHNRNSFWDTSGQNWLCERKVTRDEVAWWIGEELSHEQEVVVFPKPDFAYTILQEEPDYDF
jgi:hypothetical protein